MVKTENPPFNQTTQTADASNSQGNPGFQHQFPPMFHNYGYAVIGPYGPQQGFLYQYPGNAEGQNQTTGSLEFIIVLAERVDDHQSIAVGYTAMK